MNNVTYRTLKQIKETYLFTEGRDDLTHHLFVHFNPLLAKTEADYISAGFEGLLLLTVNLAVSSNALT